MNNLTPVTNSSIEEHSRFYRLNRQGRWQRKSSEGAYVEVKDPKAMARLQVLAITPIKHID